MPKPPRKQVNALSVLSLVFGIMVFVPFAPLLAIIFGFLALSQIAQTREQGRGMAIAGIILGFFWLLVILVVITLLILAFGSVFMMLMPIVH